MLKVQTSIFFLAIAASSQIFSMENYSALNGFDDPNAIFEEGENTLPCPPKGSYDCYRIKRLTNLGGGTVQIDFEDQKGNINTALFINSIQKGMLKKYLNGEMSAKHILDECKKDPSTCLGIRMGGHNADSKIHLFYLLHPGYSEEWQVKPWPIFVPNGFVSELKNNADVHPTKSGTFSVIDFNRPNETNELAELRKLLKENNEALLLAKKYIMETEISVKQFINDVQRYPKALIKRGGLPVGFILESPQSSPSTEQASLTRKDQRHLSNQPEKIVVKLPMQKVAEIPLNGLKTVDDLLLFIRQNSICMNKICLFDSNFKKLPGEYLLSQLDLSKALESENEDWQDDHN